MKAVFKYPLTDKEIQMPKGAIVRHVALQNDRICIWVEVDTDYASEGRIFEVYGTGHPIQHIDSIYLGTIQTKFGEVYHVYEGV